MTLLELVNLLKPKFAMMLIVSILCGAVVFAGSFVIIPNSYQATATIVVNVSASYAKGYADNVIENGYDGVTLSTSVTTTNNSVSIIAKGRNADKCIEAANAMMTETESAIKNNLGATANIAWANSAKNVTPNRFTYGIVAALAVFFIFVVWYVFRDFLKRTIHSRESVEESLGIPCVGELGGTVADQGRLLAVARLVGREGKPSSRSICFIPVGEVNAAAKAANTLRAYNDGSLNIYAVNPLSTGANALLSARGADTALLAIQQEHSTFTDAEAVIHELGLVGVNPVGFVYDASSKKDHKKNAKKSKAKQPNGNPSQNVMQPQNVMQSQNVMQPKNSRQQKKGKQTQKSNMRYK